jgi:hypothetical protein
MPDAVFAGPRDIDLLVEGKVRPPASKRQLLLWPVFLLIRFFA